MTISFFAGGLPIIGFIVALIVGGNVGANISTFLYKQYYPWVIVFGSVAIVIGLIAMYIGKLEGLSVKKVSAESNKKAEDVSDDKEKSNTNDDTDSDTSNDTNNDTSNEGKYRRGACGNKALPE